MGYDRVIVVRSRFVLLFAISTPMIGALIAACFADLGSLSGGGDAPDADAAHEATPGIDGEAPPSDAGADHVSSAYLQAVLDDLPLAYWRLGENPGATVAADRRDAYAGTYVGPVTQGLRGAITNDPDTAVRFGAPGLVEIGDVLDVAGGQFTLEMWLTSDAFGIGLVYDERYMIAKWDRDAGTGFHVYVFKEHAGEGGTTIPSGVGFDLCNENQCTYAGTPFPLPTSAFHHVAFVRDAQSQFIYIDGVQKTRLSSTIVVGDTAVAMLMGAGYFQDGGYFPGTLDEIAVYDHALSDARIQAHFAAASAP
jgi:hypothetical protein